MQLEIDGREQASALNKEQVAPSGAAGGAPPWQLSPLFDAASVRFLMGARLGALTYLQP